jgi:hypothetical protein
MFIYTKYALLFLYWICKDHTFFLRQIKVLVSTTRMLLITCFFVECELVHDQTNRLYSQLLYLKGSSNRARQAENFKGCFAHHILYRLRTWVRNPKVGKASTVIAWKTILKNHTTLLYNNFDSRLSNSVIDRLNHKERKLNPHRCEETFPKTCLERHHGSYRH